MLGCSLSGDQPAVCSQCRARAGKEPCHRGGTAMMVCAGDVMSGAVIYSSASLHWAFTGATEMPTRRLQPPELPVPSDALCTHMVGRKDREHQEKVLLRMSKGSDCFGGRRKTNTPSFLTETILPWPSLCKMELKSLAECWELAGAITQAIHHNGSLVSNKQAIDALSVHL